MFCRENNDGSLQKTLEAIEDNIKPGDKFLVTFHVLKDGKINHSYAMREFPNNDLMICLNYLEAEFVKVLKRAVTGNGRMDP